MADPKKAPRRPAAGALQSDPPTRFAVQPTRFAPPTGPQPVPPASETLPSYGGGPPVVTGGYSPPDRETSPLANIGTPSIPPGYELARPEDQGPSSLSKIASIIGELMKGAATGSQYPNFLSAMGGSYGARQGELSQQAQLQRQQRMEDESAEQDRLKNEQDRLKSEADIRNIESGIRKTGQDISASQQTQAFEAEMQQPRYETAQEGLRLQKINIRLKELEEEWAPRIAESNYFRSEAQRELALTKQSTAEMENELTRQLIAEGIPQKLARSQAEEMVQRARQARTTADTQGELMRQEQAIKESRAATEQIRAQTANLRAEIEQKRAITGTIDLVDEARITQTYIAAVTAAQEPFKFMGEAGKEQGNAARDEVNELFADIFASVAEARSLRRTGPPTGPPAPTAGSGTGILPGRSSPRGDSLSIR